MLFISLLNVYFWVSDGLTRTVLGLGQFGLGTVFGFGSVWIRGGGGVLLGLIVFWVLGLNGFEVLRRCVLVDGVLCGLRDLSK